MFGDWHRKAAAPVTTSVAQLQASGALDRAPAIVLQLLGIALAPAAPSKTRSSQPSKAREALIKWTSTMPPPPSLTEYPAITSDIDTKLSFFRRYGFLKLPAAVQGEDLRALQAAWGRHEPTKAQQWRKGKETGRGISPADPMMYATQIPGAYQFRSFYQLDGEELVRDEQAFLNILSHSSWLELVEKLVGEDLQVTHVQPRIVPPITPGGGDDEGGYIS